MPLPFIIAGLALGAAGYGVKKGVDGYKSHSEADDIVDDAKTRYGSHKEKLDKQDGQTQNALIQLGELELDIGKSFDQFSMLADELLRQLNEGRQNKLSINFPQQKLKKIEEYKFTALGVLGSVAGAGMAGAAAGFAVYGGVMTFAAASTGTAISALSGVAATNATLAAIGGGALSAGGLGIAGGTAILGAAVAAPVLAIAGWAYASHGEEALKNARKASREVDDIIKKFAIALQFLEKTESYALKVRSSLVNIFIVFNSYFDKLKKINTIIKESKELGSDPVPILDSFSDDVMTSVAHGYAIAAILTDIITTPLFKVKTLPDGKIATDKDGVPVMEKDTEGSFILNAENIDRAIQQGEQEKAKY